MAQGYKGFKQIAQQAERNLRQLRESPEAKEEEKTAEAQRGKYKFSPLTEIPRSTISTRPEWFQGREGKFAEETVGKILREGYDKSQDPIVVWKDENGDNVVISGHSRFEASERLYQEGDQSLETMPVKFFNGTMQEAMDYALLESNRSGTQEGFRSDLKAYKRARDKGYNRDYLRGVFKPENYLKLLEDVSHLNENGDFIRYMDSEAEKSFPYLRRNAQWVGTIRKQNPHLTDSHEREMFDYLYPAREKNKSAAKRKITISKDKFFDLVNRQISRIDFSSDEPLNLDNIVSTSALTDPIREQIREVQKEIDSLVTERAQKDELIARATVEAKEELISKFKQRQSEINQLITRKLLEKQKLETQMGKVERSATVDLFSESQPSPAKEEETARSADLKETIKMSTNTLEKFAGFLSKYERIDGYREDGKVKATFGRLGKQAFKELAAYLGLKEYDVNFNKSGVAGSGDLTLMGMFSPGNGIYISFSKDGFGPGVLYRTIKHMKDYSGGTNNFFNESEFATPEKIKAKVDRLIGLNPGTSKPPAHSTASKAEEDEEKPRLPEKEPWQMTKEEFLKDVVLYVDLWKTYPSSITDHLKIVNVYESPEGEELNEFTIGVKPTRTKAKKYAAIVHEFIITEALKENKPVPEQVIADYKDLLPGHESVPDSLEEQQQKPSTSESEPRDIVEEIARETEKVKSQVNTLDMLTGDNWFTANPGKILGEQYLTTDRFNKEVKRVKGTIRNVIQGMDVPGVDVPQQISEALESEIQPAITHETLNQVQRDNLDEIIRDTSTQHASLALKEKMGEEVSESCSEEYYCFEEIMEQYNKGITEDEIKAWIYYKRVSGGFNDETVILNKENGWSKYVIPLGKIDPYLQRWVQEGIMCYQDGKYIPGVLYYAENIYAKQSALLQDKSAIIKRYGEQQYQRQWNGLENIKPKYLTLADPDKEKRLILNPKSNFVRDATILKLADGTTFRSEISKTGKFEDDPKSILEVFKGWLGKLPTNAFKVSNAHDIVQYYLNDENVPRKYSKDEKKRIQRKAKLEGTELFATFLAEAISREDQQRLEYLWNSTFNGYVEINYFKVPVAFTCSKTFKNKPLFLRDAQREGIGFVSVHGTGCVAYDVGVGKTMTAILSLAQLLESGQCKRPLIVVPNQTYPNWLAELQGVIENGQVVLTGILPQYQVNDLYNLGSSYLDLITGENGKVEKVGKRTITVMTYEGFNRLGFDEQTWNSIGSELYSILNQGDETSREKEQLFGRIEELMGRGLKGGMINIEDLGFDCVVFDEVHNMKKSFTKVRGEIDGKGKRGRSQYSIYSGEPSMIGLRAFMVAQYILRGNKMRNVIGLSATPFTNSPLEIFSMLALFAYRELERSGITNIKDFFDQFIKTSVELTINAKLQPERKEVILGFNNLIALQQIVFRFINYKTGEDANIQRPNKYVLPLESQKIGEEIVPLSADEQISTSLPMTASQREFMMQVEQYVRGHIDLMQLCVNYEGFEENGEETQGEEVESMSKEEEDSARVLRALSFASQLALSPHLYACNPAKSPSAKEFVEDSPKIRYTMLCIASVKDFAQQHGIEMPGQVIYSNAGVNYFTLIREYLVRYTGFEEKEIGVIRSGMNAGKKDAIKDKFNAGEIKVLIGSASIKEGMNLQYRATDLYDLWLDWNPTDVKQLEGRIWRPGNRYANVRITFPLMENSIDIFKFQKLQEKTSRINEIWHRSGRANTLKLEELNPAELKRGLITDPRALAELLVLEEKEIMQDEINSITNQKEVLGELHKATETFNKNIGHIKTVVEQYKPRKEGQPPRQIETIFKLYKDWLEDPETESFYNDEQIFDEARRANYQIKSGIRDILAPRGLNINFDHKEVAAKLDKEIKTKKQQLEEKTGDEAIRALAAKIRKEREQIKYRSTTVEQRAQEFARLNQKVLTETVIEDVTGRRTEKARAKAEQAGDFLAASNILDDISEINSLIEAMKRLEHINKELDAILAA